MSPNLNVLGLSKWATSLLQYITPHHAEERRTLGLSGMDHPDNQRLGSPSSRYISGSKTSLKENRDHKRVSKRPALLELHGPPKSYFRIEEPRRKEFVENLQVQEGVEGQEEGSEPVTEYDSLSCSLDAEATLELTMRLEGESGPTTKDTGVREIYETPRERRNTQTREGGNSTWSWKREARRRTRIPPESSRNNEGASSSFSKRHLDF